MSTSPLRRNPVSAVPTLDCVVTQQSSSHPLHNIKKLPSASSSSSSSSSMSTIPLEITPSIVSLQYPSPPDSNSTLSATSSQPLEFSGSATSSTEFQDSQDDREEEYDQDEEEGSDDITTTTIGSSSVQYSSHQQQHQTQQQQHVGFQQQQQFLNSHSAAAAAAASAPSNTPSSMMMTSSFTNLTSSERPPPPSSSSSEIECSSQAIVSQSLPMITDILHNAISSHKAYNALEFFRTTRNNRSDTGYSSRLMRPLDMSLQLKRVAPDHSCRLETGLPQLMCEIVAEFVGVVATETIDRVLHDQRSLMSGDDVIDAFRALDVFSDPNSHMMMEHSLCRWRAQNPPKPRRGRDDFLDSSLMLTNDQYESFSLATRSASNGNNSSVSGNNNNNNHSTVLNNNNNTTSRFHHDSSSNMSISSMSSTHNAELISQDDTIATTRRRRSRTPLHPTRSAPVSSVSSNTIGGGSSSSSSMFQLSSHFDPSQTSTTTTTQTTAHSKITSKNTILTATTTSNNNNAQGQFESGSLNDTLPNVTSPFRRTRTSSRLATENNNNNNNNQPVADSVPELTLTSQDQPPSTTPNQISPHSFAWANANANTMLHNLHPSPRLPQLHLTLTPPSQQLINQHPALTSLVRSSHSSSSQLQPKMVTREWCSSSSLSSSSLRPMINSAPALTTQHISNLQYSQMSFDTTTSSPRSITTPHEKLEQSPHTMPSSAFTVPTSIVSSRFVRPNPHLWSRPRALDVCLPRQNTTAKSDVSVPRRSFGPSDSSFYTPPDPSSPYVHLTDRCE